MPICHASISTSLLNYSSSRQCHITLNNLLRRQRVLQGRFIWLVAYKLIFSLEWWNISLKLLHGYLWVLVSSMTSVGCLSLSLIKCWLVVKSYRAHYIFNLLEIMFWRQINLTLVSSIWCSISMFLTRTDTFTIIPFLSWTNRTKLSVKQMRVYFCCRCKIF